MARSTPVLLAQEVGVDVGELEGAGPELGVRHQVPVRLQAPVSSGVQREPPHLQARPQHQRH